MGMKYVKDFEFSKDAGFSGSCAPMKKAMGGAVRRPLRQMMREERQAMPARRMMEENAQRQQMESSRPLEAIRRLIEEEAMTRRPMEEESMMRRPVAPMRGAMMKKGGKVQKKVGKVMREFKEGKLHSGSKEGPVVKNPKQAMAIALSEARKMKKAEGGEVSKGPKTRETPAKSRRKAKERRTDLLAREKLEYAAKHVPGMDLDNIHDAELREEAERVEKFAKGGNAKKAVHKHEKAMHPGKPLTKLKRGGLPVHKGSPMYGKK